MASIDDRRSLGRGWVARWRDPSGNQRSKSFERKKDAENWLTAIVKRTGFGGGSIL